MESNTKPTGDLAVTSSDLLGLRNSLFKRQRELAKEAKWLDEHRHEIEARVKRVISTELDDPIFALENMLDKMGVKYHYGEQS